MRGLVVFEFEGVVLCLCGIVCVGIMGGGGGGGGQLVIVVLFFFKV